MNAHCSSTEQSVSVFCTHWHCFIKERERERERGRPLLNNIAKKQENLQSLSRPGSPFFLLYLLEPALAGSSRAVEQSSSTESMLAVRPAQVNLFVWPHGVEHGSKLH